MFTLSPTCIILKPLEFYFEQWWSIISNNIFWHWHYHFCRTAFLDRVTFPHQKCRICQCSSNDFSMLRFCIQFSRLLWWIWCLFKKSQSSDCYVFFVYYSVVWQCWKQYEHVCHACYFCGDYCLRIIPILLNPDFLNCFFFFGKLQIIGSSFCSLGRKVRRFTLNCEPPYL